ncbi:hypothetical protein SAMN02745163_02891 [Clostridium cavendishii DSM 21758]|uniref:Uncharacterized protein n=1 Tax=Clostridium cavendishii DSM 21758 TaxID=1121302 RepID=A0A1M6NFA8_9CLOT|nr:hypothetical protein [Clostridium cavendishii]SHJ94405.1 hypothetical protein SAMN02745163_02891 [Clostridium cavendishii DSM 21758]
MACCCDNHFENINEAELSRPQLQNVLSGNLLDLGSAVIGGNGPNIIYKNGKLVLNRGVYLVSYSTSAVWTTTPYGTNEAIIALAFNSNPLLDSVSRVQVPPQPVNVGLVPFELNLSKTILINVALNFSTLSLVNQSVAVMGFVNTVLTIVKIR